MLSKTVRPESRGTIFGAFSFVGDLGILLINLVGGQLYDNYSHFWPFYLALIAEVVLLFFTVMFALCGKLKV